MTSPSDDPPAFRLGYVPGATPAKWVRTWTQRYPDHPLELVPVAPAEVGDLLRAGAVDAALLRLPTDREGLHVVALYEEAPVVVVSRDHDLAALEDDETASLDDLADEVLLQPADDVLDWAGSAAGGVPGRGPVERPETTGLAIELVAAGIGVVVVPQSLARLHHRKDVTYRLLDAAPVAPVALAWSKDHVDGDGPGVDDFFGIVKGRTANSSRGKRSDDAEPGAPASAGAAGAAGAGGAGGRRSAAGRNAPGKAAGGKGGRPTYGRGGGSGRGTRRGAAGGKGRGGR